MNINIAVLEDKKEDYHNLSSLIYEWENSTKNTVNITWFRTASEILKNVALHDYDLLFSDIEISTDHSMNGIEVCHTLRKNNYQGEIVFLTAFSEFVFDGYGVHAFNYLLKPLTTESLNNCMSKYIALHADDYYYHHKGTDIIQIPYNAIISIYKDGHDIIIQTDHKLYYERASLNEVEKRLPPQFLRCHKSAIINLMHIKSIAGTQIHLSNNKTQCIGRSYLAAIRKAVMELALK